MLANKTAIVTGSTAGVGKAIARSFLKEGAFVFINGRSEQSVASTILSLTEDSIPRELVHGVVADISTAEGAQKFFTEVESTGRAVDILVNNMGIFSVQDFFSITDEVWKHYFDTNVLSTVRFCRQYLKPMLDRNAGRVLIISSECGMRPIGDMLHYATTKAAQINLARGLAELTKGTKVTVNSILPGPTATEGVQEFVGGIMTQTGQSKDEVLRDYFQTREPTSLLQRFLTVEEIADTAVFLASDRSSGINGSAMRVEGGIIRSI